MRPAKTDEISDTVARPLGIDLRALLVPVRARELAHHTAIRDEAGRDAGDCHIAHIAPPTGMCGTVPAEAHGLARTLGEGGLQLADFIRPPAQPFCAV